MRPCIEKSFFNGLCRRQKDLSARKRCFSRQHAACVRKGGTCLQHHALPFTDAAPVTPRPGRSTHFPYALTLRRLPTAPSDSPFPSAPFFKAAFFKTPCRTPSRAPGALPLYPDAAALAACSFSVLLFALDRYQKTTPASAAAGLFKMLFCVDSAFRRADAPRLICVETARPPSSPPCGTGSGFFSWPARRPAPRRGILCFPAKSAPPPGSTDGQRHTASSSSGSDR